MLAKLFDFLKNNRAFIFSICTVFVLCLVLGGVSVKNGKGIKDALGYQGTVPIIPVYWLNEHGVPSNEPESVIKGAGLSYATIVSSIGSYFYNKDSDSYEYLFVGIGLANQNSTSGDLILLAKNADGTWDGGPRSKSVLILAHNIVFFDLKTFFLDNKIVTYILWSDPNITGTPIKLQMITENGFGIPVGYNIDIGTLPLAGQSNTEPTFFADDNGNPIVAWVASTNGVNKLAVSWWSNNAWRNSSGNTGFEFVNIPSPLGNAATRPSIILKNNNLFINFIDMGMGTLDTFLIKKTPTGWSNINGSPISPLFVMPGNAKSTKMKINPVTSKPCVAFIDGMNRKAYFAQFNGTGWVGMTANAPAPEDIIAERTNILDISFDFVNSDYNTLFLDTYKSLNWVKSKPNSIGTLFAPFKIQIFYEYLSIPENLEYLAGRYYDPVSGIYYEWGPRYFQWGTGYDQWGHLVGGIEVYCVANPCAATFEIPLPTAHEIILRPQNGFVIGQCDPDTVEMGALEEKDIKIVWSGNDLITQALQVSVSLASSSPPFSYAFDITSGKIIKGGSLTVKLHISTGYTVQNSEQDIYIILKDDNGLEVGKTFFKLKITTFTISTETRYVIMKPGDSEKQNISISYYKPLSDTLTPSIDAQTSIPTGLTITFDPTSINTQTDDSFDIIFTSTSSLAVGEYKIIINVTSGFSGSRSITIMVRVVNYDLICYESTKQISRITSFVTYTITVIPRDGYTGQINVSVYIPDNDTTFTLMPTNPIDIGPGETTFDVTLNFGSQWNGRKSITITTIDYYANPINEILPQTEISLVVERGNFNVWVEQEHSVLMKGDTGTLKVYIENYTNDNLNIDFSASNLPYGWTKCFDYSEVSLVARDTTSVLFQFVTTSNSNSPSYDFNIIATDTEETDTVTYSAKMQDFQVSVNTDATATIIGGDRRFFSIFVQSYNDFDGYVGLYVQINPSVPWIECTFEPQIVKCKPNGIVTSGILIKVDAGLPLNNQSPQITITGKCLESDVEKICEPVTILNNIKPIDENKIRMMSAQQNANSPITSFTLNCTASYATIGIVFECQPFKLIRQIKQTIQQNPIQSYSTFIPYLAMNTFPNCSVHFDRIEILYPWAMGGCYGNNFKYSEYKSEVAFKWEVQSDLPTLFDQNGYCHNNGSAVKIINTDDAKKAIGMPSPSTIHPEYINAVWSKTYSSEDRPQAPCNNNVCVSDLRVFAYNVENKPWIYDQLPPLEPGTTIIIPLRAIFTLTCTDNNGVINQTPAELTRYCEITYEKPLPNHSQGGEKITNKWFVGDTHVHSANSVVRLSSPNPDSESTNEGCPEHCACLDEDPAHIGRIQLPAGPSITQRAEECRELSYDFTYMADHSSGDGGGADTVDDAWNKAVTSLVGMPNECQQISPCPTGGKCNCARVQKYWDAFGVNKDVVLIGKGGVIINSQEVANRSYETTAPDKSCDRYHCTGRLVSNYHGAYIPNFMYNKLQLLMTANGVEQVPYKYVSNIIAHMHEEHCGTMVSQDDSYPLTKEATNESQYPGVNGFPWDYPGCVQSCDPWADWPNEAPSNPLFHHPPNTPFGMRHKTAPMQGGTMNDFGYDGFELMYQGYTKDAGPNYQTYQRWKTELGEEIASVFSRHPLGTTGRVVWTDDGPPAQFCRDIWHPFGVGASNVMRWWMGPWNRYYGYLMTYINNKEANRYKNDIRGQNDTGLINPLGYYLRTGKVIASGKGSFATMWAGTKVNGEWVGPKETPGTCPDPAINWSDRDSAFQPGDMISKENPCETNCCAYRDQDACSKIVYRIIMKSAWTGGTPIEAKLWLHTVANPQGSILRQYTKEDFKRSDLSDCSLGPNPNNPILSPDDFWFYKDDCIESSELPTNSMWCLRLEVTFQVPGYSNETVLCSPIYSK